MTINEWAVTLFKSMPREREREGRCELQLKRQAFHRSIRRRELNDYFSSVRSSLASLQRAEYEQAQAVAALLAALPASVHDLLAALQEDLLPTCAELVTRIEEVAERMVRLEVTDWGTYMYVLERLLASVPAKEAERVVRHTLLGALECAEVLAQRHRGNRLMQEQIAEHSLEYCLRCGRFLAEVDRLQLSAVIGAVVRLWRSELSLEQQVKLLQVCNNILGAQFDQEEAENISPQREEDLELLKKEFINNVFYRDAEVLLRLVPWTMEYAVALEDKEALVLGLRLLVNITLMVDHTSYYYPLLSANVLHLVNSCLLRPLSPDATVFALRLLNNLLVNDHLLTLAILREVHLPLLAAVYRQSQSLATREEVVILLVNLLHFLNEDSLFVRELVNTLGVHELIFDFLGRFEELDEQVVSLALTVLIIAHTHHPAELRRAVVEHAEVLHKLARETTIDTAIIEEILMAGGLDEREHV